MNGLTNPEPLSVHALVLNLLLGLVLSAIVAGFYARYGEALSNRHKFARLLPLLSLTTVLVISVVKASLALSLGLVGALSIVRFRTAIKDPEELLYLFLAIAIGLGLGADQRAPTLVAVGIIVMLLIARRILSPRAERRNLYVNVQTPDGPEGGATFEQLNGIVARHCRQVDLRRLDSGGGTLQATYLVDCDDESVLARMMDDLKQALPACTCSFVDVNSMPGA